MAIQARVLYPTVPNAQLHYQGVHACSSRLCIMQANMNFLTCFFLPFLISGNNAFVTRYGPMTLVLKISGNSPGSLPIPTGSISL